jgi:hypothetical protein
VKIENHYKNGEMIMDNDGRRNSIDTSMFQWGATKNAIILLDMARFIDKKLNTSVEKNISRLFNKIDDTMFMVNATYSSRPRGGFKEHFIWNEFWYSVNTNTKFDVIPGDMFPILRAVVKEKININKTHLKLIDPKNTGYTPVDLIEWSNSDHVKQARNRWKKNTGMALSIEHK